MINKNKLILLFLLLFFIQIFQLLYFNRNSFRNTYDNSYWKDRFEHSQWVLPLSNRIIGDDGLFSHIGYSLINGADPSKNNPETQPVGKYLIGLSIKLLNNPVYYSLLMGIMSLLVYYFLCNKIFKDKINSLFATTLLLIDPLFFTHLFKPWVDITQLFFLLLNFLGLLVLINNKKKKIIIFSSVISGISLGLFFQTKLPILFPLIIILEGYIFLKKKYFSTFVLFILSFAVGIIVPYLQFFLLGNNLIDFIKLQKYIVSFYLKSQLESHFGAIWQVLLTGNFININETGVTKILEWWFLWPVSFIATLFSLFKLYKTKNEFFIKALGIFAIVGLLIFGLIPSYPRYLLMIIPFFYIFFTFALHNYIKWKHKISIYIIVLIFGLINSWFFLLPKPDVVISSFYHNLTNQYFQDIYEENITKDINLSSSRFRNTTMNALNGAEIKHIEIDELARSAPLLSNHGWVKIKVKYKTLNLGAFSEEKTINLKKEGSEWKIDWNWDLILNDFSPEMTVKTDIDLGKRGKIIYNGEVIAEDKLSSLISVKPEKISIDRENEMLEKISSVSGVVNVRIQNAYLENAIPGEYVPLTTTYLDLSELEREDFLSYPGLMISNYFGRVYRGNLLNSSYISNVFYNECCTRIYSSYNYHGVKGIEKQYDGILSGHSGGKITILDNNQKLIKTIHKKEKKNGQDVILPL